MVSRKRHAYKAITWRFIGTLDTMLIGWLVSGDWAVGIAIGGIESITKIGLYYLHERAWYNYTRFGVGDKNAK